jgi:hypothetical protein
MTTRIIRIKPRPGGHEKPWWYERGYQLADPSIGAEWHHVKNAVFARSLEKAADLIEHSNFAIRMGRTGLRPSLIRRSGLRIIR